MINYGGHIDFLWQSTTNFWGGSLNFGQLLVLIFTFTREGDSQLGTRKNSPNFSILAYQYFLVLFNTVFQKKKNERVTCETVLFMLFSSVFMSFNSPTIYLGECNSGVYAVPALVDSTTATIAHRGSQLLLEGPPGTRGTLGSRRPKPASDANNEEKSDVILLGKC